MFQLDDDDYNYNSFKNWAEHLFREKIIAESLIIHIRREKKMKNYNFYDFKLMINTYEKCFCLGRPHTQFIDSFRNKKIEDLEKHINSN